MNNRDTADEDFLRDYINPGKIEKAPMEFTSKTMTRIRLEAGTVASKHKLISKYAVPVISLLIILVLFGAAFFIPSAGDKIAGLSFIEFIGNLRISVPEFDFNIIPELNLPGWILYSFPAVLLLAFFDRALWGIFHREK